MTRRLDHEHEVLLLALAAGLPGTAAAIALLAAGGAAIGLSGLERGLAAVALAGLWLAAARAVRRRVAYPLRTVANLLEALRAGDFSLQARRSGGRDALAEVLREVNALASTLREERLGALEATALLRRVMEEIDVAVFVFDAGGCLRLLNRAGERLLGQPAERLLGLPAAGLGLAACLEGEPARTFRTPFATGEGPWGMRRRALRQGGRPHQLLVLTDLSRALREEERAAWQRLLRVLGHELNNSLAPIRSLAETLRSLLARRPRPADWEEDAARALGLIGERADALGRFVAAYGRLAKLPPPQPAPIAIGALVRRVAALEGRLRVQVLASEERMVPADAGQLEQLLINLIRNAADAALETGGGVRVGWGKRAGELEVWVEDDGPGLPPAANLFVPLFTTKPGGSGIGLAVARQIAEAHGGSLELADRGGTRGCIARLRLPASA